MVPLASVCAAALRVMVPKAALHGDAAHREGRGAQHG
jgi:hypothetical protein